MGIARFGVRNIWMVVHGATVQQCIGRRLGFPVFLYIFMGYGAGICLLASSRSMSMSTSTMHDARCIGYNVHCYLIHVDCRYTIHILHFDYSSTECTRLISRSHLLFSSLWLCRMIDAWKQHSSNGKWS
jgi:hypothetical protein